MPMNLGDILQPRSVAEFLGDYFGVGPLHVPGPPGRFSGLAERVPAAIELAEHLERELETPVRLEPAGEWTGLAHQRTERDAIVLQTAGRDKWSLYGSETEAAVEPSWGAILEAGGMLYIPRNYWCAASPVLTPSSNRVYRIDNPTGIDLLAWFASLLKEYGAFHADVPRFACPARQAAYLTTLRKATNLAFRSPSLLDAFTRQRNNFAPARQSVVTGELSEKHWVVLTAPRYPKIRRVDAATICLRHDGREIRFPVDAAPLLQYLLDKMPVAVTDFYRDCESEFDRAELSDILLALERDGIVAFQMPQPVNC